MKILWILFVWPEPQSSAAGCRTMQLIEASRWAGHEVHLVSPAQSNEAAEKLTAKGYALRRFEPNDPAIDLYLKESAPDVVIFDRFMVEEQFSWRVRENAPNALRVLDTIDLHSLRRIRGRKLKEGSDYSSLSDFDLNSEDSLRELASIYRSDLSLVTSDFEFNLLNSKFGVSSEQLFLSRLFYEKPKSGKFFSERRDFVFIGNFNHPPNFDGVHFLVQELWRKIRDGVHTVTSEFPELHLYGSYVDDQVKALHNPAHGIYLKGWTPDAHETLSQYRVNLAYLRFGAGIKGKISDGWFAGTPCITTEIGAEGMYESLPFGGAIASDNEQFIMAATNHYTDVEVWNKSQRDGYHLVEQLYNIEKQREAFIALLNTQIGSREESRAKNHIGAMLWREQMRSTEFFSRWIEAKNRAKH